MAMARPTRATGGGGGLARWGPIAMAVALDVVFVLAWWALVYYPGEDLVVVRDAEALRWSDTPIASVRRLAPDGAYALVASETNKQPQWHFVDWSKVRPGDIADAAVGTGRVEGRIVAAVWVSTSRQAVVIAEHGGKFSAWRWGKGEPPRRAGPVESGSWIDDNGAIRSATALGGSMSGGTLGYAGNFVVNQRGKSFKRVARLDGVTKGSHGKSRIPGIAAVWDTTVIYESSKSSTARVLLCDPNGVECEDRTLGVKWGSGATAAVLRPRDGTLAVCQEGSVHIFQTNLEAKGVKGVRIGTFDAPAGCDDLHWLSDGHLFIGGGAEALLWGIEDRQ